MSDAQLRCAAARWRAVSHHNVASKRRRARLMLCRRQLSRIIKPHGRPRPDADCHFGELEWPPARCLPRMVPLPVCSPRRTHPALLLLLLFASAAVVSVSCARPRTVRSRVERDDPEAGSCTHIADMDYSPTESHGSPAVETAAECCAACFKYPSCKVGVFQNKSGCAKPPCSVCYLKGGFVTPTPKPGSGLVACVARHNPTPAPAFDCSAAGANCASRLGATHWNPCYFLNASAPVRSPRHPGPCARITQAALCQCIPQPAQRPSALPL